MIPLEEFAPGKEVYPQELHAWKLFHIRKNGTLGPLFIDRRQVLQRGIWLPAANCPTKGYAERPGWHAVCNPDAVAHLSTKGRVWVSVCLRDWYLWPRPESQGGTWVIGRWIKLNEEREE